MRTKLAARVRGRAPRRGGNARLMLGLAQLLLVVAAGALWTASRLPWVIVQSFDGLGPPRDVTLNGASWSTALLPLAILMLVSALAAIAVRGWPLRLLAGLLAVASFAVGYLSISLWVLPDVAVRGAELAHVSLLFLVGSQRRYPGAVAAVVAAVCTLVAAVLLMRSASPRGSAGAGTTKYVAPAARRSIARRGDDGDSAAGAPETSERMIWDALDEGRDPTDRPRESDTEGR
jgi:uncharacterized membrane protein (TIGR02234 family)